MAQHTHLRGERHHQSKLSEADVRAIRSEYASGNWTYRGLAAKYGVSSPAISFAVNRQTWKHVS